MKGPTLGEAIVAAHKQIADAEAERRRLLGVALDNGVSTRELAHLLDASHSTVWRWAGGRRLGAQGPTVLDAPLSFADPDQEAP